MISRKDSFTFVLIAATFLLSITFLIYSSGYSKYQNILNENNELISEINQLRKENAQYKDLLAENTKKYENELNTLKQQLSSQQTVIDSIPKLSKYYIGLYKSKNLNDPIKDISANLSGRTDLIPQKAVLGGKMKFEELLLLSPDYAYAAYSDGHITGHMILKFNVTNEGKIDWQVINQTTY